jgi:hypothetical protein
VGSGLPEQFGTKLVHVLAPLDLISGDQLVTDADIACVVDDKFIIAEVKESVRNINEGLADSLVCIARIVRPDVVILACSDPTAFATVTRLAAQMHDELRDVGVSAMPLVRSEHDADLPRSWSAKASGGTSGPGTSSN